MLLLINMEEGNNQTILAQPSFQVDQEKSVTALQQQPFDTREKNKKLFKILAYVLASVALVSFGAFGLWFYQEKTKKVTTGPDLTSRISLTPTIIREKEVWEKKIVFLKGNTQDEKEAEIWTIKVDGSDEKDTGLRLKNGENFGSFHQSPDMNYACFTDGDLTVGQEVFLLDIRKNEIKQISNSFFKATEEYNGSWLFDCAWSLDSKKIAYRVSHHPQESLPGGGLPQKDPPPAQFEKKMGGFIYDIVEGKLERVSSEEQLKGYSSWPWTPASKNWKEPILDNYFFENSYASGAKLLERKGLTQSPVTIYETKYYVGQLPPLQISPDKTKIAFADYDGMMVVFDVNNPADIQRFEGARVDGMWSKYEWLSNNKILFWQSREGHKYNTEHGSWYQGNLLILNIQTGDTKKLTEDGRAFWRQ